jgi:hypothetical protein
MTADAAITNETTAITARADVCIVAVLVARKIGELPSLDKRFWRPTLRRAARAGRWQPASVVREGEAS